MAYYITTKIAAHGRGDPPAPVRNATFEKRNDLIDRLVDTAAEIIDKTWPAQPWMQQQEHRVVATKTFIQEILKRSRTTYSNLQLCLFYIFRIKSQVVVQWHQSPSEHRNVISCGRRMFLASLMVAAKFLQDKNYRNRAWSRISGLSLKEINAAELAFLKLIQYDLFITKEAFDNWHRLLQNYMYQGPSACCPHNSPMLVPPPMSSAPGKQGTYPGPHLHHHHPHSHYHPLHHPHATLPNAILDPCQLAAATLPSPPTTPPAVVSFASTRLGVATHAQLPPPPPQNICIHSFSSASFYFAPQNASSYPSPPRSGHKRARHHDFDHPNCKRYKQ
ncbi:cyclin-domain-containing protein [Gongronella butleri]|nr:cyclin-domain-containing protein [Gongronella butleri]